MVVLGIDPAPAKQSVIFDGKRFYHFTPKEMLIPEGISTLGFASCPHWSISQYIFGYPVIEPNYHKGMKFELVMDNEGLFKKRAGHFITEIHPALFMWILLKESIDDVLFMDSWKCKGDSSNSTKKRSHLIVDHLFALAITQEYIDTSTITITSDDELDAFVCWLMGRAFVESDKKIRIYGDSKRGSFLLPYDKTIYESFKRF